ncbi:hypothetical protein ACS0TY_007530 [Phlomoides rotata]
MVERWINKLKFSIWLSHKMNHQDMGERWTRRALVVEEMVKTFKELNIEYRMLPLDVNVRNINSGRLPSNWTTFSTETLRAYVAKICTHKVRGTQLVMEIEISSMEIEDDTITVHDNEIEAANNQNAILEDDIVEGIITTDENEENSANKNDIVPMEISDVLTNTILVEEHDDEARTANIDEVVTEEGGTAKADTTLEKGRSLKNTTYYLKNISHARALGFSVRKGTTRYNTSGKLQEKYFYCSSLGYRECKQSVANDKETKRVHITRTGCKALIRVKLQGNGCYAIINHVKEHNHELTRPEWSHLHRSERQITDDKEITIEDMISSGLKPTDSFRYMAHDAGVKIVLVTH